MAPTSQGPKSTCRRCSNSAMSRAPARSQERHLKPQHLPEGGFQNLFYGAHKTAEARTQTKAAVTDNMPPHFPFHLPAMVVVDWHPRSLCTLLLGFFTVVRVSCRHAVVSFGVVALLFCFPPALWEARFFRIPSLFACSTTHASQACFLSTRVPGNITPWTSLPSSFAEPFLLKTVALTPCLCLPSRQFHPFLSFHRQEKCQDSAHTCSRTQRITREMFQGFSRFVAYLRFSKEFMHLWY